jgi:hypothetical protein
MLSLSPGAVELPMHHVSVRVPWHDTDWTGRVCASPRTNQSCAVLNRIKKEKDPDAEAEVAGKAFGDVDDQLPPCVLERGGYAIWLLYGLSRGSVLVLVHAAGLACGVVTLAVALRLRGPLLRPASWRQCD